jgi:hypothetical protein
MANKYRGEVDVEIGGTTYTVALNLNALANLETAFEVNRFEEALNRMSDRSAATILRFFSVVFIANGYAEADAKAVVGRLGLGASMRLFGQLIDASELLASNDEEVGEAATSPLASASAGSSG